MVHVLPWSIKDDDWQMWSMKFCMCGMYHVGSTQVPFLMCTLEIPQNIAAQVLALNVLLSFTFEPFLKLSFSQTMSLSCIFVLAPSLIRMDLSIMQTQHP